MSSASARHDEVLTRRSPSPPPPTPSRTWGAPGLLDSTSSTWTMDPALLEEELRALRTTRAAAEGGDRRRSLRAVRRLRPASSRRAAGYDVPLIEDAAEALGRHLPGRAGGPLRRDGGVLVQRQQDHHDLRRRHAGVAAHRVDRHGRAISSTQARDPAPHYQHSEIGYNYRMSNLLAAVGRGQLRDLDRRVAQRRAHQRVLPGVSSQRCPASSSCRKPPYGRSNCWLTCITIDPQRFGATREESAPTAGARQYRVASGVEADAHAARLQRMPCARRRRV